MLYFVVVFIIGNMILLSLFTTILMDNFHSDVNVDDLRTSESMISDGTAKSDKSRMSKKVRDCCA
jgi:hypothetical protein